jgi:adenylosuccinate synthase
VTKLDVLDHLAEIPVCVAYKIDGKTASDIPAQASGYDKIECIYQKLPGWKTSTEGITDYAKLPSAARDYLAFVEKEAGAKVGMISTGPDRDHTILMADFVSELKTAAKKA